MYAHIKWINLSYKIMFVLFMSSDMSGSVFTVISLQHRMSAYSKSHNPFADDDDEEDSKPRRGFNFDDDPEESSLSPAERRQRQLQQEVMHTAQSAVDSSYRSLGLIYESEKVGAETAEVRGSI